MFSNLDSKINTKQYDKVTYYFGNTSVTINKNRTISIVTEGSTNKGVVLQEDTVKFIMDILEKEYGPQKPEITYRGIPVSNPADNISFDSTGVPFHGPRDVTVSINGVKEESNNAKAPFINDHLF